MKAKNNLILKFIIISLLLSACRNNFDHEYMTLLDDCYNSNSTYTGFKKYKEIKKCIDCNLIGKNFPEYQFLNKDGDTIDFKEINKPIYLQILSRRSHNAISTIPAIKKIMNDYKDKVEFLFIIEDRYESISGIHSSMMRKKVNELWKFEEDLNIIYAKNKDRKKYDNGEVILGVLAISHLPITYILTAEKKIFYVETFETCEIDISQMDRTNSSFNMDSIFYYRTMQIIPKKLDELIINSESQIFDVKADTLNNFLSKKIKALFLSKVYLISSFENNTNKYHKHLEMFNEKGTDFFPVYSSKENVNLSKLNSYETLPFDGILFASLMDDDMLYKINYSLNDEIVINGKRIKEILKEEIEKFKKENSDLFDSMNY